MIDFIAVRVEHPELTPRRANRTDAGLDLRAKEDYILPKGGRVLVDTGVQVRIPEGYVGLQIPRSSLSKSGIQLTNSVGVIDSDYRGNILASLMFTGSGDNTHARISQYDRITQLVIVPILLVTAIPIECEDNEWNDTARGTGGFGSTGNN